MSSESPPEATYSWFENMNWESPLDIISDFLKAKAQNDRIFFHVDSALTDVLFSADEPHFVRILDLIADAKIFCVEFNVGEFSTELGWCRFLRFCRAIGHASGLDTLVFNMPHFRLHTFAAVLDFIRQSTQSTRIRILDSRANPVTVADIQGVVGILEGYPSLELHLSLSMPTVQYREALPIFQGLPQLTCVTLDGAESFINVGQVRRRVLEAVEMEDTEAIANLIKFGSQRLEAKLVWMKFHDAQSRILADGISQSVIQAFELCSSNVDPEALAFALAASSIKKLTCENLFETSESRLVTFLTVFGTGLRSPWLEELELGKIGSSDSGDNSLYMQALAAVARGAGNCSNLRSLYLPHEVSASATFDQALASCVSRALPASRATKLECIDIDLNPFSDIPKVLPLFVEAMKTNCTIKEVCLSPEGESSVGKPYWDPDTRRMLEVICRLNRVGRQYLETGALNKRKGINVLAQVTDHLDCIYFHLSENPGLVDRLSGLLASPPSKRARLA